MPVVLGIGNGGCRTLDYMIESGEYEGITFIAVDSDKESLNRSKARHKILLSWNPAWGKGINGNSKAVRRAAQRAVRDIAGYLEGADMAFIIPGMGGRTGTGLAPVLAETARKMGILTVGIAFLPFQFEGLTRLKAAHLGAEKFSRSVDSMLVVDNEKLWKLVNEVPRQDVQSVSELLGKHGFVKTSFEDIRTMLRGASSTVMGLGVESGENRMENAIRSAIGFPFNIPVEGASRVVLCMTTGPNVRLVELERAEKSIREKMNPDARLAFGHVIDKNIGEEVKAVLFAAFPAGK